MDAEKCNSTVKETLKSLCCNNGWCYGIFWEFDQRNSLLLTSKDAYCEEQMGALIDKMLLQVHVLGGGAIGQAALSKDDRWIFSDNQCERKNSLGSLQTLDVSQGDYEFNSQFSLGIETIALISVEHCGVAQFGSTNKIPEMKDFVKQVNELFKVTVSASFQLAENEPGSSKTQLYDPYTQFMSQSVDHAFLQDAEGLLDSNNSLITSSQFDNFFSESGSFFDFSATKAVSSSSNDCSVVTSSWHHLASKLHENVPFSSSNANAKFGYASMDLLNTSGSNTLLGPIEFEDVRSSGLFTLEELFQENDFAEAVAKSCPVDNISEWFTTRSIPSTTSSTLPQSNGLWHANRTILTTSAASTTQNFATHSVPSSVNVAFGADGVDETLMGWSETLKPMVNYDDLRFKTDDTDSVADKCVEPKVGSSNSLFSKLGLNQLLDGMANNHSASMNSRFDDQSPSPVKRRKIENISWIHNQGIMEDRTNSKLGSFDGEAVLKGPGLCTTNSCSVDAGKSSTPLKRQDELVKNGKKKATMGSKPRPKDRQMIQDRLLELRELIPNGEKMSIDRLLERTIRHLNFMDGLIRHAETLKQIDKPKSGTVLKDNFNSVGGGVTWACEVNDEIMVCPLKVEDLSTPGQMLIEILCEEQGFFLEIANLIRGFGLIILNGAMEVLETKIRAHFVVEAEQGSRHVKRHEIFSSLVQLLQMASPSAANANNDHFGNVVGAGMPSFSNRCHTALPFPVNLIG